MAEKHSVTVNQHGFSDGDGRRLPYISLPPPGDEDNVRPERTGQVIGPGSFDSRVTPSEPTAVFDAIEPVLTTDSTFVLVSGRLGAAYEHQRLALIGLCIFGLFSLANGFCRSFAPFVAIRALSGVGGGIYMLTAITALGLMVPLGPTRNFLYGIFAAAPPLGGLVGALALGAISVASCMILTFILPSEHPVDPKGKLDIIGVCLGMSGLRLFNIAWSQSPAVGWSTPSEIVIFTVSVVVFVAFPLGKICYRSVHYATQDLPYMSFGISLWYSISWQQVLRQLSVLQIAVNLIPFGLGSTAAVGLAAYMLPRVEAKLVMAVDVVATIGASLLLATMPMQQTYSAQMFPVMLLCGCCPDFVYLVAQAIASNSVTRKHQGIASSLVGTLNLYGISLGLGFAGTIEVEVGNKSLLPGATATMESVMSGFNAAL
ncbi:major facilitator superfamily transporter [Beauveria brongniartii RCEF 3172]|uniref:Major facilitator superfamily transporter n=1 Tax=Beauveria brongniartii RCEF 3172 TaxID=1081107 RepID=A0A162M5A3_9HYPO|nr:major facilitator superfamily transporter [Beauveria brongniartii RCEF 3172]